MMTLHNIRRISLWTCLTTLTVIGSQPVLGHGNAGDIALFSTNGQADVGFAVLDDDDITQLFFDPNDSVFQSLLINQPPVPPNFEVGSSEPGFDANENELPPNADITINNLGLWFWDGTGVVTLEPTTNIDYGYFPQTMQADGDGGFHEHPVLGLADTGGAPLADGVYVVQQTISVDGLADSDPYFVVTLVDDLITESTDAEDTANMLGEMIRDFQEDPVANPSPMLGGKDFRFYADAVTHVESLVVPEPSSLPLAGGCLLAFLAFSRRR